LYFYIRVLLLLLLLLQIFSWQSHTDSSSKEIHTPYGFHSFFAMFTNADHYLAFRANE